MNADIPARLDDMGADIAARLDAVGDVLATLGRAAVAVSGGVDSLTLATIAHRRLGRLATMFHARSAAVPEEATARVRAEAIAQGWQLEVIDAGEFARTDYVANPVNRCFHCKTSLYSTIVPAAAGAVVVSGTNLDDLGEYRPGLDAARDHGVRHPFVEAMVDKSHVRALARHLGLADIAELPAAPCLSSRVETGIAIRPEVLAAIHKAERLVTAHFDGRARTVRCRVRAAGVVVELDVALLEQLTETDRDALAQGVAALFRETHPETRVGFAPYRNGSAFLVNFDGAQRRRS